jgi:hypothetical protein
MTAPKLAALRPALLKTGDEAVFNSAGRNAASFGAVMAGVLAAFAL